MYIPQKAAVRSGIRETWEASEFKPFIDAIRNHRAYRPKKENVLLSSNVESNGNGFERLFDAAAKNQAKLYLLTPRDSQLAEYGPEKVFAGEWAVTTGFTAENAFTIFAGLRVRKSPL